MRRRIIAALLLATAPLISVPSAHAQFFGGVVFDPTNYGQNLLTAIRSLEQINNQIRQLQNEADMLVNDARNLVNLDVDVSAEFRRLMEEIFRLTETANAISYKVEKTDEVFRVNFPEDYKDWSNTRMAETAEYHWQITRAAYHDTLLMQSQIVETVRADTGLLDDLMRASQSAEGNKDVAQAGNQIMALNAKQNMQIQQLMATQYRAEALERARRLALEREARVRHQRFVGGSSAYTRR